MNSKEVSDLAWEIYCESTKGAMSSKNTWQEIGRNEQDMYLSRAIKRLTNKEK